MHRVLGIATGPRLRRGLLLFGALLIFGCARGSTGSSVTPPADLRALTDHWLTCVECSSGELTDLVAVGDQAVPLLEDAVEGFTRAQQTELQAVLSTKWAETARFVIARGETPALTQQQYVGMYVGNLTASVQRRAIIALEAIGSSEAEAALQRVQAAHRNGTIVLRPDILAEIQDALRRMVP